MSSEEDIYYEGELEDNREQREQDDEYYDDDDMEEDRILYERTNARARKPHFSNPDNACIEEEDESMDIDEGMGLPRAN